MASPRRKLGPQKSPRVPPRPPPPGAPSLPLRLSIGKDGLGLELGSPTDLGPFVVTDLQVALPRVRFPVDVSGGVSRFRHRRGELVGLGLELPFARLERLMRERLRGLLCPDAPDVWVGAGAEGAALGLASPTGAVLAFEVLAVADGGALALLVTAARGIGLPRPAVTLAAEALRALVGAVTKRAGVAFVAADVASLTGRRLFPEAGVRVPTTDGVVVAAATRADGAFVVRLSRGSVSAAPGPLAATALEAELLLHECDDKLTAGDLAGAREAALAAVTRAPGHAGALARIADIDRVVGERAETALELLAQVAPPAGAVSELGPVTRLLVAELRASLGQTTLAETAFVEAAEAERVPLLAARALEEAARLSTDARRAAMRLDAALARAPGATTARLARMKARLAEGRVDDAFADAEELEAQAKTSRARYAVWKRCADVFLAAGLRARAARLYERALRFVPDDADAVAGLGRALADQGNAARGARLLARAIDLFGADDAARDATLVDLADLLADRLDDVPTAIARLDAIGDASPVALRARAREAKLRATLGDLAGASFAWTRLRAVVERGATPAEAAREHLAEAAAFELEVRSDARAAQRHALLGLTVAAHDERLVELARRAGLRVATLEGAASGASAAATPGAADAPRTADVPPPPRVPGKMGPPVPAAARSPESDNVAASAPSSEAAADPAALEARVEELTSRLRGDPKNDAIAEELTRLLLALDRPLEVFALLSARVDEAAPEERPALRSRQRDVILELARRARAAGNDAEAALFESFASAE